MVREEDQEAQAKSSIRIVDRRRFDSDGEEKEGADLVGSPKVVEPSIAASVDAAAAEQKPKNAVTQDTFVQSNEFMTQQIEADAAVEPQAENLDEPTGEEPEISFGSFVLSLATQALVQLGQIKPPDGMRIPVDPVAGKQTIDILSVLETKTKGNLDAQEERLLKEALHNLRLAYLRFR